MAQQTTLCLPPFPRGFHLITGHVERAFARSDGSAIREVKVGLLHVFVQHTSASLTINENADPTVRHDFEAHFNNMVPENAPYYQHDYEGSDDMPAHLKAAILGSSVTIPITNGQLNLGTWQGIYLCEHRDQGGARTLVLTVLM